MKHFLKVLLVLVLCVTLFAACDDKKDGGDTTTTTTTTDPNNGGGENPPAGDGTLALVNADGTTNYRVITQTGLTGESKTNVLDFISKVQSKTGVRLFQYQENEVPLDDYEITINVQRNRPDAAEVLENTPYTHYRVEVSGNRIIVTAFSEKGLYDALNGLYKQIKRSSAEEPWTIPADYSVNELSIKKTNKENALMSDEYRVIYNNFVASIGSIPKFHTQNGSIAQLHTLGNDGFAIAVKSTNLTEYEAYVQAMLDAGFTQYSVNTMSAGSTVTEENIYHTFTAEKIHVFTHWQPSLKVARIYFMPPAALPELTPPTLEATDTVPVTIAQMHIAYASFGGMSYVYQLADGKFIIVDGGVWHSETQQYMIDYLNEKAAAAGMAKPEIAMWILSHPHGDHTGFLANGFLEYCYNEGINIESFAYNFADQANTSDSHSNEILTMESLIEDAFPDAIIYTPHAGQVYYFKGLTIEILATEEELYPFESANKVTQNSLCMTWRVILDNGKTAMFLADNTMHINEQLAKVYRDYLKSDILQTAHHGLSGGEISCYKYIDPDICLWPSPYLRFMGIEPGVLFGGTLDQDQWGLGFRFVLVNGVPVDEEGNPTDDPDAAKKSIISAANIWLLDESIKDRLDFHNTETVIIGTDLSITIKREPDPGVDFQMPTFGEGETPDYKAGIIPHTGS